MVKAEVIEYAVMMTYMPIVEVALFVRVNFAQKASWQLAEGVKEAFKNRSSNLPTHSHVIPICTSWIHLTEICRSLRQLAEQLLNPDGGWVQSDVLLVVSVESNSLASFPVTPFQGWYIPSYSFMCILGCLPLDSWLIKDFIQQSAPFECGSIPSERRTLGEENKQAL